MQNGKKLHYGVIDKKMQRNIKIEDIRKFLNVGDKAIEIETKDRHHFIANKNKDEIIRKLKPSLIIEKNEAALKPLIYTMPDGYVIKGLAKKTKNNKIVGVIKTERPHGNTFMQSGKEKRYSEYKLFEKDVEDIAKRWLTSYIRYYANENNDNINLGSE